MYDSPMNCWRVMVWVRERTREALKIKDIRIEFSSIAISIISNISKFISNFYLLVNISKIFSYFLLSISGAIGFYFFIFFLGSSVRRYYFRGNFSFDFVHNQPIKSTLSPFRFRPKFKLFRPSYDDMCARMILLKLTDL